MLRRAAQSISFFFHPIFIIPYVLGLLLLINPHAFTRYDERSIGLVVISVCFIAMVLPLVSILAMRFTGLIKSIQMDDKMERIGPLIVTGMFYLWLFVNIKSNNIVPTVFSTFVLGSTIGLFLCFFINNFSKISLHSCAAAGLVANMVYVRVAHSYDFFLLNILDQSYKVHMDLLIMLTILIFGLVATSRLLLKKHSLQDIYGGMLVGIISQIIAIKFLG